MKKFQLIGLLLMLSATVSAQETIKAMFYNVLMFPSASPGGRTETLKNIVDSYDPDIFMICELETKAGGITILNESLNVEGIEYVMAPFQLNTSSGAVLQQLVYFKKGMFTLETVDIIQTNVRDINRYKLLLETADQAVDPVFIDLYVTHLKSSQGSSNVQARLDMVTEFTNSLSNLDPNAFILFAGDLNLYTSSEPAYQELLDPSNAITMVDPIDTPGSWNNNVSFQAVHTQSTRINSGPFGAGAGGGMDDRFDFILMSENMQTDPKLRYIPDTYKSYGNNGNCYNNDVSSTDCTGEFSQELRNYIFSMSDHLPVVMEFETNKEIVLSVSEATQSVPLIQLEKTIVSNVLSIQISEAVAQPTVLSVYNVFGQRILKFNSLPATMMQIDVSHLAEGIYYLKSNISNSQPIKFLKVS